MSAGAEPTTEPKPQPAEAAEGGAWTNPPWPRMVVLAAIVGAVLALVYLSPLRAWLGRLREMGDQIRGLGILAPLVVMLSIALLVAVGVSRLLLCSIAGAALGFWSGLLWAQLGTLLGNYATFLVARFIARRWAEQYLSNRVRLHALLQRRGIAGVILARQLPVPGLLVNLACGLFPLRHRHFLIGTLVGQLPEAVPFTLIGAGALQDSFASSVWVIGLGVAVAVVAWIGLRRLPSDI
ncbi:MAG TPA: VTT domain-containing protein [Dongiaceae bacterium]|nr:VTT domain-containing protein [Dongiaceae bacterium]